MISARTSFADTIYKSLLCYDIKRDIIRPVARATRVDFPGAWYHVLNRGTERRSNFYSRRCHQRFIELLSILSQRFGVRLHGYALMGNHYHLQLESREANLSQAIQWLNVSSADVLGYRFTAGTVSVGVDYLVLPGHLAIGAFGAYSHTRADLSPSGSVQVNTGRGAFTRPILMKVGT
jgi:hypothetical protein